MANSKLPALIPGKLYRIGGTNGQVVQYWFNGCKRQRRREYPSWAGPGTRPSQLSLTELPQSELTLRRQQELTTQPARQPVQPPRRPAPSWFHAIAYVVITHWWLWPFEFLDGILLADDATFVGIADDVISLPTAAMLIWLIHSQASKYRTRYE